MSMVQQERSSHDSDTDETAHPAAGETPDTDQPTENQGANDARTACPGLMFWIASKGFDFQIPALVQKFKEVISMTGIQLLECEVLLLTLSFVI